MQWIVDLRMKSSGIGMGLIFNGQRLSKRVRFDGVTKGRPCEEKSETGGMQLQARVYQGPPAAPEAEGSKAFGGSMALSPPGP